MPTLRALLGLFLLSFLFVFSCKKAEKSQEAETTTPVVEAIKAPDFQADSAYSYIQKQVEFGPRVPGTVAQKKCAAWLGGKFKALGLSVQEQNFNAVLYDGKSVPGINIIASYNPEATKRILLASHWDSRPISDQDAAVRNKAIDGANDGASGVGVLVEIARNLVNTAPNVGVDFVLFDVEDWGAPESYKGEVKHEFGGYCLGSEYWSKNLHKANYSAYYGILLDMVGAKDAKFYQEQYSFRAAPSVVSTVWSTASQQGFGNYFINAQGGAITDDHIPVNVNAKIPMIDIIDYRMDATGGGFFPHWHTTTDNMSNIDKSTLKAVGQTLLQVIYQE